MDMPWRGGKLVPGLSTADALLPSPHNRLTGISMPPAVASSQANSVPLCVDLDGTLIRTDVLWESLALLLKRNPLYLAAVPFWLLRGRAFLKQQIAARTKLNPASLPYNHEFVEFLRAERRHGRPLILATAADIQLAQSVARHSGLFSDVVASDGANNLRGRNKGRALAERYGKGGFDYAGNSSVDLPVWREARQAVVVNAGEGLARRARQLTKVSHVFHQREASLGAAFRALRPHQWIKNLIIFVPLVTSHQIFDPHQFGRAALAFVAFCLCASGVYVLNDLLDLDADRQHDTKKLRPLASGELALSTGLIMVPVMLALSAGVAACLSWNFAAVLAVYFLLTTGYSWRLKQVALLDVFVLAGLYTIRLVAGHEATRIEYSFWLLAFSMFIFLSLALVKRFTELSSLRQKNKEGSTGRGYFAGDLEMVAMFGIASGFLSVLVMALYVNSDDVRKLYQHPILLLLMCPLLLFWISRVWLVARRGRMHDDPIVFALKDGVSYLVGALAFGVLWAATAHF
jgi:4-hydroxybenzoate polyprenyltransferase/phosphoserine phosphatase